MSIGRCVVYFNESKQHVEPVTFFGILRCAPADISLGERRSVVFLRPDWADLRGKLPSELRYGQSIDAVVLRMGATEIHEGDPPTKIESKPPSNAFLPQLRI
jgi:hypothetical protein